MGGQPGKPKPPGNPPVRPEPQEPKPIQEPPTPIPIPPVEIPPAPIRADLVGGNSLRACRRLAQNFRHVRMVGRRSDLFWRLPIFVSQGDIGPIGDE